MRALAAAAALTVSLALVPAAEAAFPGSNGRIAFSSIPCFGGSVCEEPEVNASFVSTIGPAGRGRVTLPCTHETPFDLGEGGATTPICSDSVPAWSPDGTKLAIATADGIWVSAPDGSGAREVVKTPLYTAGTPAFTADGSNIAYSVDNGISIVPLAGGAPRVLLPNASSPAFSSTGRLAFERGNRIWVAAADGSGARPLRRGLAPDWAPGARRIIFSCGRGICRMTPKGRLLQHVRRTPEDAQNPVYSPDGTKIAFDYNPGFDRLGVYVVRSIGARKRTRLAAGQAPSWQPRPR